jgi:hypothetical protein
MIAFVVFMGTSSDFVSGQAGSLHHNLPVVFCDAGILPAVPSQARCPHHNLACCSIAGKMPASQSCLLFHRRQDARITILLAVLSFYWHNKYPID